MAATSASKAICLVPSVLAPWATAGPIGDIKRIKKRTDDKCWFCEGKARMTKSHALLHYPDATSAAARVEAW
jgi:hypothetical protein